jgi:cytochrome c oxidase subunit 1
MFVTPLPELGQGMFTAASMMIVIPNGIQIFCWLGTMWGARRVHLKTPMLFVIAFIATFVIGGLTGVMLASVSVDLQVHDTMFVVAHLHYVLIGGAVFPLFGAFYYWFPKWTGRMMSEKLGVVNVILLVVGFHLTFWPLHHLGLHGMPRRIYTYNPETGWGPLNHVASMGAGVLFLAVATLLVNMVISRLRGRVAGPNPWGGETLEWAAESPPSRYSFLNPPTVQGRSPMWENAPDAPVVAGLNPTRRQLLVTTTLDAAPHHRYDVHGDSIVPLLMALVVGLALIWGGVFHPVGVPVAAVLATVVLFAWFWTSGSRRNTGGDA